MTAAHAQQSHWATPDDKSAKFMIDMERKWAEGVCTNNGVISELLADDFQGTSTRGERYHKADELRDEKGPHSARGCALDDAKVRFFGENVAITYGSEHTIGEDRTHPDAKQCQVWTDVWLKRDGRWRIVAAQDNKVDCKYWRMILLSPTCLANEIDNGPVLFALLEMIQCQCHGFMSPQPTGEEHVDLWAGIFKGSRMAAKVRRAGRLDPNHIIVDFDTDLSGVREPPRGSQNQSNNVTSTHP